VISPTNAATMETGNYGNPGENRSVTICVLCKLDDDDDGLCRFYYLIFSFMQWSRKNQHNARLRNFLIFIK